MLFYKSYKGAMPTATRSGNAEIDGTWEEIIAEARAELAERLMKSAFLSPEKSQRHDVKKLNVN